MVPERRGLKACRLVLCGSEYLKENSGIWQIREKCKDGNVANHVFLISSDGIFLPRMSHYGTTHFTVKSYGDVAMQTSHQKWMCFQSMGKL
jgi:hypothetical protein